MITFDCHQHERTFREVRTVGFTPIRRVSNVTVAHSSCRSLPTARTRMKSRGCWNPRIYRCCTSYQPSAASRRTARRLASPRIASRRVATRSLIRCVGASWRRVTNDNATVTSKRTRRCQSDAMRNSGGQGKGRRCAV